MNIIEKLFKPTVIVSIGIIALMAIVIVFSKPTHAYVETNVWNDEVKVNLCHKLGNGSFNYLQVDSSAKQAHLNHGDFLYQGPNGTKNQKDAWCNSHQPEVTPTPTPTQDPVSTPSAKVDEGSTDKCPNLNGVQITVPQGMAINDKQECYDLVTPTPAPSVLAAATSLPATGSNDLVWGLWILDLGLSLWLLARGIKQLNNY